MTLETVWKRLGSVRALTFNACSSSSTGWKGSGDGIVDVSRPAADVLVYAESGTWSLDNAKQLSFTNVYRWTLLTESLKLEHLRFGPENPVYLFDLSITDGDCMESVAPHV